MLLFISVLYEVFTVEIAKSLIGDKVLWKEVNQMLHWPVEFYSYSVHQYGLCPSSIKWVSASTTQRIAFESE